MAATTAPARARRGRVAAHDNETLLDLVADVARAAELAGAAVTAARVSMPAFDRVKRDVDVARAITDPDNDPERTPTADAVQRRFREVAGEPVAWSLIVEQALRAPEQRTMWLAALGREQPRDDLSDELVIHALRRVAAERRQPTLAMHEYAETQRELVAVDKERFGEDGLMEKLLPTLNQVLGHCGLRWESALVLAGLELPQQPKRRTSGSPNDLLIPAVAGMSVVEVAAFYAALNERWPSYPVLRAFATSSGVRMQDAPAGGMKPVRAAAAQLLEAEGITPPGPPKALGRGKRLTYRYPVAGIPGAPRRDHAARSQQMPPDSRITELGRELAVLSVRKWLTERRDSGRRVRAEYVAWQRGSDWTSASTIDRNYGGFAALKREATEANAAARRSGVAVVAEQVLVRAQEVRAELRAIYAAGRARQPEPVPFAEALAAVSAGPHETASPPKQQRPASRRPV
jgi:hypothetical protein